MGPPINSACLLSAITAVSVVNMHTVLFHPAIATLPQSAPTHLAPTLPARCSCLREGLRYSREEDQWLALAVTRGLSLEEAARVLQRSPTGVKHHLKVLRKAGGMLRHACGSSSDGSDCSGTKRRRPAAAKRQREAESNASSDEALERPAAKNRLATQSNMFMSSAARAEQGQGPSAEKQPGAQKAAQAAAPQAQVPTQGQQAAQQPQQAAKPAQPAQPQQARQEPRPQPVQSAQQQAPQPAQPQPQEPQGHQAQQAQQAQQDGSGYERRTNASKQASMRWQQSASQYRAARAARQADAAATFAQLEALQGTTGRDLCTAVAPDLATASTATLKQFLLDAEVSVPAGVLLERQQLVEAAQQSVPQWEVMRLLRCRALPEPLRHFAALRLHRGCSEDHVRGSFRRLSLVVHPDKNQSQLAADAFAVLGAAHRALLRSTQ